MSVGRILLLCLVAITLAMSGPVKRALSLQAMALPQTTSVAVLSATSETKTSANPSKRCLRGAIVRSNCHFDLSDMTLIAPRMHVAVLSALEIRHGEASATPPATRIFRPPRFS